MQSVNRKPCFSITSFSSWRIYFQRKLKETHLNAGSAEPWEWQACIKSLTDLSKQFSIFPSSPSPTRASYFCPTLKTRSMLLMQVNFGSFECCSEMERYCGGLADCLVILRSPNGLTLMPSCGNTQEEPQRCETKPLQTAWWMYKVKFGLLGGYEYN